MIIKKYNSSNFIIKEWDTSNIKFDTQYVNERVRKINSISRNSLDSNLLIAKTGRIYFSVSEKIESSSTPVKSIGNLLQSFAEDLDFYHSKDLIHGDIKFSNIVFSHKHINLIDWEPVLEYTMSENTIYRSTMPFISSLDLSNKKITKNTDKISFFFLCNRLLKKINFVSREEVLSIENKICTLNCKKIFNLSNKL